MSQTLIRRAFEDRLKAWADAQGILVAWEGVAFTPPETRYLRAFLLPASTSSDDLGRVHRRFEGVFQVSVHVPNGMGAAAAEAIVLALDTVFPTAAPVNVGGLVVHVLQPASAGPAFSLPGFYVVAVSMPYRADTIPVF